MTVLIRLVNRLHQFLSRHLFYPVALSTLLVFFFFASRAYLSQRIGYPFLIWNLFLAWLPYLFSLSVAAIHRVRPNWWWVMIFPGGLWLLFLPNAFYIVTDFIHLRNHPAIPIWYDAGLLAISAWTGIFLAIVSLSTLQDVVQAYLGRVYAWVFALVVIGMSGYGVYLGRFLRWNSWDVLNDPYEIISDSLAPLVNPLSYADKIGFIVMYTSLYLVTYLTFSWLRPSSRELEKGRDSG